MRLELVNKKKIRADDYVAIFIVISYILFFMFFHLEALLAIAVYPFVSLGVSGFIKIITAFNTKRKYKFGNINKTLLGIIYIMISVTWLNFILIEVGIPMQVMITLYAFPIMIVGFAGIIKGYLIDSYAITHRIMSIFIGVVTLIICVLMIFYELDSFLFNIVALSFTLLFNILSRAALYLSEYGLSLVHLRNFKLFLYIVSDYLVFIDTDGNLILKKI
ncbi:MAG: hypothetical protein ACFE9Q_00825 [Candidatus Hodarchaeota archaeon]